MNTKIKIGKSRNGIASLEMVLVLPFLMMLMAMIIVFGYAASWKMRTETVARDVVWRARWHRFANPDARPVEWPSPATFSVSPTDSLTSLNDPVLLHPIITGPLPGIGVDSELLNFRRGMLQGQASVQRSAPLFATLTEYQFEVDHPLLDHRFQHRQMGFWNYARRFPIIYDSAMELSRNDPAIAAAASAVEHSAFQSRLVALDRDPDFLRMEGWAPDFYPRLRGFRSIDTPWVEAAVLEPFVQQIRRLPRRMGNGTIQLFRRHVEQFPQLGEMIRALQAWLDSLGREAPPGGGR